MPLTNWEIFVWALGEAGGSTSMIDVEDVFIKCFNLAPQRFAWRTRADIPDYKKCAKALRDAEARRPALLIKRGDRFGRQLTVAGQQWIRANRSRLPKLNHGAESAPKRGPKSRLLSELESSETFETWKRNPDVRIEKWKIADVLRCSPDSSRRIWSERLETLRSAAYAAQKGDVLRFLDSVSTRYPDWFEGRSHEA
jgi:hypothetical protein